MRILFPSSYIQRLPVFLGFELQILYEPHFGSRNKTRNQNLNRIYSRILFSLHISGLISWAIRWAKVQSVSRTCNASLLKESHYKPCRRRFLLPVPPIVTSWSIPVFSSVFSTGLGVTVNLALLDFNANAVAFRSAGFDMVATVPLALLLILPPAFFGGSGAFLGATAPNMPARPRAGAGFDSNFFSISCRSDWPQVSSKCNFFWLVLKSSLPVKNPNFCTSVPSMLSWIQKAAIRTIQSYTHFSFLKFNVTAIYFCISG